MADGSQTQRQLHVAQSELYEFEQVAECPCGQTHTREATIRARCQGSDNAGLRTCHLLRAGGAPQGAGRASVGPQG